jgi:hypothetical protein
MGRPLAGLAVVAALVVACAGQVPVASPTGPAATTPATTPSPQPTVAPTPTLPPFGELPPVRFTLSGRGLEGTWTDIFSFAGPHQERVDVPRSTFPGHGVGDILVWDGRRSLWYKATDKTYSYGASEPGTHALDALFNGRLWSRSGATGCPDKQILEEVTLLGRRAVHIACKSTADEWWVDLETGLFLRDVHPSSGLTMEITKLEYKPTFPPGTFDTSPPRGAKESSP